MEAIQVLQLQTDAKHRRITGQVKSRVDVFKSNLICWKIVFFFN